MASERVKSKTQSPIAEKWLEDDRLMLLSGWTRDGYTYEDIANRIGITTTTLRDWRNKFPEIEEALQQGREIVDYKVENALLKSALGYHTKEVKVTTTVRFGKTVETIKEVTDKEQAPNVSAIQTWLFNRLPDKWKRNRDNLIDLDEEDTKIQVTVTRANKANQNEANDSGETDKEWQDEINNSIEIRKATKEEQAEKERAKAAAKASNAAKPSTKAQVSEDEEDLDYWPDDWEDEEEWED